MRGHARKAAFASVAALALALSACGGDDDDGNGDGGEPAATGGSFSVYIGEPENPLIPGNTSETEGGQIVDSLWTGLVQYNHETNEAEFTGVAESIETDDQTTFTVTLNEGWTFHDGTDVTAQSYVDTWNWIANSTNAQGNSYFFANVEGYDDLQAPTDAEGNPTGEPAATEMTGLEVVDDLSFTVKLTGPFAQWPVTVGYTAFFPYPESFFADPVAFGEQPVGNGPFMAEEPFVPGEGITLTKYEDYAGEEPANADEVEYRIYTEQNTAYTDLQAGNLDIVDQIPPDAIASAPDELGDRFITNPRGDITSLGFPMYDPRYGEDVRVRQAISMAIDRASITEAVFLGTRTPATSFVSPVVDGYRDDACEWCTYDPERANELLDEAGFDRSIPIDLWFNGGAGHEEWMQAVGNSIRDALGVEYVLKGDLQFDQYLPLRDEKGMTGPFREAWIMDYPSPQNFLEPIYSVAATAPVGSNTTFYASEEFDELIAEGNQAADNDEAIAKYQEAEDVLLEDFPSAPLWYGVIQGAFSEHVDNVVIDAFGRIDAAEVTVNQ